MIYAYEVDDAIKRLSQSGVDVFAEDYVIYANSSVKFDEALYPLQVMVTDYAPKDVAYITKRIKELDAQIAAPAIILKGAKK
jgi:hypothetical protein